MNKVIINTKEIESVWEKDNLCFIKMKSGKVWLCEEEIKRPKWELFKDLGFGYSEKQIGLGIIKTSFYIEKAKSTFVTIPLAQKDKCDDYGNR